MSARDILREHAGRQGWDDASLLEIALEYIDSQGDGPRFADFVARQALAESDMAQSDMAGEGDAA